MIEIQITEKPNTDFVNNKMHFFCKNIVASLLLLYCAYLHRPRANYRGKPIVQLADQNG